VDVKGVRVSALVLLVAVVAATPVVAVDFGFQLSSTTEFDNREDDELFNSETLAAWLSHDFSQSLSISTQGSYTFTTERPYLFDLDALYLDGATQAGELTRVSGRLGRFGAVDATGYVFDHRLDGGRFSITAPRSVLSFTSGYTGLLLKPTSDVEMSRLDQVDDADDDEFLAPRRLVGLAELRLPEIFPASDLWISLVFQEDLRPEDELIEEGSSELQPGGGGRVDTQYTSVQLEGSITGQLFYTVFGIFQTGRTLTPVDDDDEVTGISYEYKPIFAGAAGAGMRYYIPTFLASRTGFEVLFATGDDDHTSVVEGNQEDASTQFLPISSPSISQAFAAELGNLIAVNAFYSLKPLANAAAREVQDLTVGLDLYTFLRATEGPVAAGGVNAAGDGLYLGSEVDATVAYRPFSDLGISLTGGIFFPNSADDGPIAETEQDPAVSVELEASFSF
jgi:hypothetical protein